jgi:hypothetical protein
MTKLEEVARGLFQRFRIEECDPPQVTWEEHAIHTVEHAAYIDAARAAIEALRRPNDAMLKSCGGDCGKWAPGAWSNYLDAILSEGE